MASPLAKGLIWGVGTGAFLGLSIHGLDHYIDPGLPGSQAKIEACAASLGNVATDILVLDPACEGFDFNRTEIVNIYPLGDSPGSHTVYHVTSSADFPAYAVETKKIDDARRNKLDKAMTAMAGGLGLLMFGPIKYKEGKRRESFDETGESEE